MQDARADATGFEDVVLAAAERDETCGEPMEGTEDPEVGDSQGLLMSVETEKLPGCGIAVQRGNRLWVLGFSLLAMALVVGAGYYIFRPQVSGLLPARLQGGEEKQEVFLSSGTCAGTLPIAGLGMAAVTNSKPGPESKPSEIIEAQGARLVAHIGGRAYLGDTCAEGQYDNTMYKAIPLLGNTLRYTVDISDVGCGCNAAVYLASLKQNPDPSVCGDYYCDSNAVCGVRCTEIDIQEANMFAWRSTLHMAEDGAGVSTGYGGRSPPQQDAWEDGKYGPAGQCIDTRRPFQVAVGFPLTDDGLLKGMQLVLSQEGSPCPLTSFVSAYSFKGRDGMAEIERALAEGMTPIVSFWKSSSLAWFDGEGPQGGTCAVDTPDQCPDSMSVESFSWERGVAPAPAQMPPSVSSVRPSRIPPSPASTAPLPPATTASDTAWKVFVGKDAFAANYVDQMNAADIAACKRHALAHNWAAFVVWRGVAYFRLQRGPECEANLVDNEEATTYILRSSSKLSQTSPEMAVAHGAGTQGGEVPGRPGWLQETLAGEVYYYNPAEGRTAWSMPQPYE